MTTAALRKKSIELGVVYSFRGIFHYQHGGKHGGTQKDLGPEEVRILRLDPQEAGREKWGEGERERIGRPGFSI